MKHSDLVFDWNTVAATSLCPAGRALLHDETLRDGLQSPSVKDPFIEDKIRILHLMEDLGIDSVDIGLPGAGRRAVADAEALGREIVSSKMKIKATCAARTLENDIRPVAEISQRVGLPIEVSCFLGSSPIRRYTENWTTEFLLRTTEKAVKYARSLGLEISYVTEDTSIRIDWHGHSDRGLAVANSLAALAAGADCVHGTALGIGERVGNTQTDQMLVNLKLMGVKPWADKDLMGLKEYCATVSKATGVPIPRNYPVLGDDAFRTATGVHAAAVIKAFRKGDIELANTVYSGVPSHYFGLEQIIEIGPMSGKSNVIFWLERHGLAPSDDLVDRIFQKAKISNRCLTDKEIMSCCAGAGATLSGIPAEGLVSGKT